MRTCESPNETITSGGLRAARLKAGLTQVQLAVAADCSPTYLQMIEAGAMPKRSVVLERIVAVLNDCA